MEYMVVMDISTSTILYHTTILVLVVVVNGSTDHGLGMVYNSTNAFFHQT
jgi:hypothetical protein